jgi:hypothetical protein
VRKIDAKTGRILFFREILSHLLFAGNLITIKEMRGIWLLCCDQFDRFYGYRDNENEIVSVVTKESTRLFASKALQPSILRLLPSGILNIIAEYALA